jgi:predicted tellurium resistance membrane protein TerC
MTIELLLNFVSLTFLQIILMIDNLIFVSVLTEPLLPADKAYARKVGFGASVLMNIVLIVIGGFLTSFHTTLFSLNGHNITPHNIIMFGGGLFLLHKVVKEFRCKLDNVCHKETKSFKSVTQVIINMILIDLTFSFDSTIIAVGMTDIKWMQIGSVLIALVVMYFSFNVLNKATDKYPSLKILALAFLFLIGFSLFSSGLGFEIPKGYMYSAMFFSLGVELLMIKFESKEKLINKILNRKSKEAVTDTATKVVAEVQK